jgi:hypothetical protein
MIKHDFKSSWIVARPHPLHTGAKRVLKAASAVIFVLAMYFLIVFCFSY